MPAKPDPNPSQKGLETLLFIIAHVEIHGFQPSQAEIALHFGVSRNAIQGRLRELARRDIISLPEGSRERAVVLHFVEFTARNTKNEKPNPGHLRQRLKELKSIVFTGGLEESDE